MRATADLGGGQAVAMAPSGDLAELLRRRGSAIAGEWRKRYYRASVERLQSTAQLEGVVEPLLAEVGRSLETPHDLPASAWGRTGGLLRLSLSHGAEGLAEEFGLLRQLVEEAAAAVRAAPGQRRRARVVLEAAQAQALALLRRHLAPDDELLLPPAGPFAGIVVETA